MFLHVALNAQLNSSQGQTQGQSKRSTPHELDGICIVVHIIEMWAVNATDEYLEWFGKQTAESKEALLAKVLLLKEFGPQLGRPHADTLKGSRIKNLKELRARTPTQVLRVLYYFDDKRQSLLLVGGNKKGKSFYKKLIQSAEMLIERYRP